MKGGSAKNSIKYPRIFATGILLACFIKIGGGLVPNDY